MSQVLACYKNILESSTVTLTAGTENSSYPLWRVYDRDIGKLFKTTAAVTTEIKVDQGASGNQAVDRLIIPVGHNLNGRTLDIKWSDDNSVYTEAVAQWVQGDAGIIVKNWASITHRYWKFIVTSPASIPEIPEVFLTQTYTWEQNPDSPCGPVDSEFNVENEICAGGQDRFLVHGNPKKQRSYSLSKIGETQKGNLVALNDAWAGSKPFWLCDIDDAWIYGKLRQAVNLREDADNQYYSGEFDFLEVLP